MVKVLRIAHRNAWVFVLCILIAIGAVFVNVKISGIGERLHAAEDDRQVLAQQVRSMGGTPVVSASPGEPGSPGASGNRGIPGVRGPVGNGGSPGVPGVIGPTGPSGAPGAAGQPGQDGTPGQPGIGEQGPQGEKGDKGEKGDQGEQGPTGPAPATVFCQPPGIGGGTAWTCTTTPPE